MEAYISKKEGIIERPPVIVVMGHIDHGKSKLLDYIRKSHVVEGEAGGITQHISAYEVIHQQKDGEPKRITFLDTPGHEAFSGMRSRGASVADVAILVVAADDGVKAQTVEALSAINEAGIPYIVALNKIDKPNADQNKAIQSLIENEIYIEGYGGDIPFIPVSATVGTGIEELLDTLVLVSEMEELKGDTTKPATGVIIETNVDTKKGISATIVIKDGTLKKGMYIVAEKSCAPVRIMEDFTGNAVDKAQFSSPIQIRGFDSIPSVGSLCVAYENRKDAEGAALSCVSALATNDRNEDIQEGAYVIPVVLKSDVVGTEEAIREKLKKLCTERSFVKIVHSSIGKITEGDVKMAGSSENAYVIGFNVKVDGAARELGERMGIEIKTFNIIYELLEWFEDVIKEETPKKQVEEQIGEAKILRIFNQDKNKQVIGGKVVSGYLSKGTIFKIKRRDEEIGTGKLVGIQQQKMETDNVQEGNEFGCRIDSKIAIAEGDRIISFRIIEE
ncbi:translation initiation factor IF-2 [Candidatus Campbellbacteria bacterium CG22_combo_CG10-13_8_21_14_all_36_13]|uniref:Translation initiation factor IF-2 n=1 Tax=Candidatus Campbellbacteria bacterium CG22_combo_CG10-13_8_21_14_all_36_13 TaxID=1974529 RepID=A0A2H0E040_9BACT|nr:MAG: translation initiation factor IF-2 [Candidatus Campbellbacteria bacterium CG22_combo_CG10-13_8_21_14_all_36_13]